MYEMNEIQQSFVMKINWISQSFCVFTLVTSKISIALLISRVFDLISRQLRIILMFTNVNVDILAIVDCIMIFVQCHSSITLWTLFEVDKTKCWSLKILIIIAICIECKKQLAIVLIVALLIISQHTMLSWIWVSLFFFWRLFLIFNSNWDHVF